MGVPVCKKFISKETTIKFSSSFENVMAPRRNRNNNICNDAIRQIVTIALIQKCIYTQAHTQIQLQLQTQTQTQTGGRTNLNDYGERVKWQGIAWMQFKMQFPHRVERQMHS